MVKDRVVDKQILTESQRQLQSNQASLSAAEATVNTTIANQLAAVANLEKAEVDVTVAEARLEMATADRERLKALNGYLTLTSPFDGIIVARNANTGDFVLPASGDPSAPARSNDQSASKASPVYVVARTDVVRVFVDVPEADAINMVCKVDKDAGDTRPVTSGRVRIYALSDSEIPGEASRCTWALNFKSRTLRTEIDLPNTGARLRPGMYAYGKLVVERPNVKAVPLYAVQEIGNQFGCYLHEDGKAVWTQMQIGANDGTWIELQKKLIKGGVPVDLHGSEQIIVNNFSELSGGRRVRVAPAAKLAKE
jgi:multidrug efflux pump subunit AcrA (membrane-fusion protein)